MLTIKVLGPTRISCDGKLSKKGRALLAILAVLAPRGNPVDRDKLAELLWPYHGRGAARHSLRNCLWEIRKALGSDCDDAIVCTLQSCCLLSPSDVYRFEALAYSGALRDLKEAAALYRGDLLHEFWIQSEIFDEWLTAQRARLHTLAEGVFSKLCELSSAAGEHDVSIDAARRLLGLDSLDEKSHRLLIHTLENAGRSSAAVRQYKACETMLRRELGVRPEAETEAMGAAAFAHASRRTDAETTDPYRVLAEAKKLLTKINAEKRVSLPDVRELLKKIEEILPSRARAARELHAA